MTSPPVVVIVTETAVSVLVIVVDGMVTVMVVGNVMIGVVDVAVAVVVAGTQARKVLQGAPPTQTPDAGHSLSTRSVLGRLASMLMTRPAQSKLLMHTAVSRQALSDAQSRSLVQVAGRQ